MEALQDLNSPILSCELPHRFCASRGAQEVPVTAFQIKLFFLWHISQWSQTTCLPSEQDLIWITALKLCDFIQIYDAKPFREEQRWKGFHLRVWEGETVMLMHILPHKCRTGTVTSRNPQNSELDLLIFLSAWLRYCFQLLFHLYSQNWNGSLLLCWEWHLLLAAVSYTKQLAGTNSPWWAVSAPTADWDDRGVLWLQQFLICMPIP